MNEWQASWVLTSRSCLVITIYGVYSMTLEMVKGIMQEVNSKEKEDNIYTTQNKSANIEDAEKNKKVELNVIHVNKTKMVFQCEDCDFECEKEITLNKHKNTKHTKVNSKKDNNVNKAHTVKDKFHYEECIYSCMSKKSLKKYMSQNHEIPKNIECNKCEMTFEEETELQAHVEEKHCSCTPDSVCDECVNYWAHKSQ